MQVLNKLAIPIVRLIGFGDRRNHLKFRDIFVFVIGTAFVLARDKIHVEVSKTPHEDIVTVKIEFGNG